jgi:hypothetical protein
MKENVAVFGNSGTSRVVLTLTVLVSGFWWLGQVIDVYRLALVGAIFELLWLPVLAMSLILPIVSLTYLMRERFTVRSLYLYSTLIGGTTVLFMFLGR